MKYLSVVLLSVLFSFGLYSCGDGDDPVYAEYQEYPGDLTVLGLRGPIKTYRFSIQKILYDDVNPSGEFEELIFNFDEKGNLTTLIFNTAKVYTHGNVIIISKFYDEESEVFEFSERDQMGRVTLRTTLDGSDNIVATTSYGYDDRNRKCIIESSLKANSSADLDEYGYYGAMFSVDFKNRDMLNRYLKELPKKKPTGNYEYTSFFDEDGFGYWIEPRCEYY